MLLPSDDIVVQEVRSRRPVAVDGQNARGHFIFKGRSDIARSLAVGDGHFCRRWRLDTRILVRDFRPALHAPVILLSARAGEEARVEGIDAGADDYLIKPFSARELIARVNSNLELARREEPHSPLSTG